MEKNEPRAPGDPRPENKPAFIPSRCPHCGRNLALADRIERVEMPEEEIWQDEWMCPTCRDRIYLDIPGGVS
jgi:uncharacterized protein with PIN domain